MEKIDEVKQKIIELLHGDNPAVIALKGEWGSGKTHFWREIEKEIKSDKKCAYISLFGLESTKDIRINIAFQVKPEQKILKKFKPIVNFISTALSKSTSISIPMEQVFLLLSSEDFKEVIICFDDIERKSKNLNMNDFLGLISELKEQKECKVVVILNEDELDEKVKGTFSQKKEKIFDRQFLFQPPVEWAFEKARYKHTNKNTSFQYFKELNMQNIRIMKLVANVLDDFKFVNELAIDDSTKQNFFYTLTSMATVYHKFDITDFEKIQQDPEYLKKIGLGSGHKSTMDTDEEKEIEDRYIKAYSYYYSGNIYYLLDDIKYALAPYFSTFTFNKERLKELLLESDSNAVVSSASNTIIEILRNFAYDLSENSTKAMLEEKITSLVQPNKEKIISSMSASNFIFLAKQINSLGFNTLVEECLKYYLDNVFKSQLRYEYALFDENNSLEEIRNFSSELAVYMDKKLVELESKKIYDLAKLTTFLEEYAKGNTDDEIALTLITKEQIKEYLLGSKEFTRACCEVIRKLKNRGGDGVKHKKQLIANVIESMNEIEKENKHNNSQKIALLKKWWEFGNTDEN